jgi:hypothetical protein
VAGGDHKYWMLGNKEGEMIVYGETSEVAKVDLSKLSRSYVVRWIDPKTGSIVKPQQKKDGVVVMWVSKK